MNVSMNVGSSVKFPVPAGASASSSDTSIMTAAVTGDTLTVTGVAKGKANLTVSPVPNVSGSVAIEVVNQ